jgi:hypothetical protein
VRFIRIIADGLSDPAESATRETGASFCFVELVSASVLSGWSILLPETGVWDIICAHSASTSTVTGSLFVTYLRSSFLRFTVSSVHMKFRLKMNYLLGSALSPGLDQAAFTSLVIFVYAFCMRLLAALLAPFYYCFVA